MFGCKQPLNRLNKKAPSEEEAGKLFISMEYTNITLYYPGFSGSGIKTQYYEAGDYNFSHTRRIYDECAIILCN